MCSRDSQQGVPIDSHLLSIFRSLGWIPNEVGNDCPMLARASIEGWFPKQFWGELNQVYAGLGQIFRDKQTGKNFMEHAWDKNEDPNHILTYEDYLRLERIAQVYSVDV